MASKFDRALAKARLLPRPYSAEELAAAETRLMATIADQMLYGALYFDDCAQRLLRDADRPRWPEPEPAEACRYERAADDLIRLCNLVLGQPDALHQMANFMEGGLILEPHGARVLACVLHLAGRDGARFWWQYAAGAGDDVASCCLSLHHMALGEVVNANHWHQLTGEERAGEATRSACCSWTPRCWSELGLHTKDQAPSETTEAVVGYVATGTAVQYVADDDIDLDVPLPEPEFAERIEQISAGI
jgi:hypothetical protein